MPQSKSNLLCPDFGKSLVFVPIRILSESDAVVSLVTEANGVDLQHVVTVGPEPRVATLAVSVDLSEVVRSVRAVVMGQIFSSVR